ncbi:MAG: CdaR family protein [Candidatus Dormibacteria bacterium]
MARLLRLVTRNFQLKVIAILVACGMWVGVVYASDPPAIDAYTVAVHPAGLLHKGLVLPRPIGSVQVKVAGFLSQVHSPEVATHLTASADLSHITQPGEYLVKLTVQKTDDNVSIWSAPKKVKVVVDSEKTVSLPVHLSVGANPPPGYDLNQARTTISPSTVQVEGPESVLANLQAEAVVDLSQARVSEPISSPVTLVNTDGLDNELTVTPNSVTVDVAISSETTQTSVGVKTVFAGSGQPATGYEVTGLQLQPLTVTVSGPTAVLTNLTAIDTEPIDISHATASETVTATLVAPAGTTLSPGVVSVVITVVPIPTPSPSPSPSP